ncbi:hypothetical protein V5799_011820 [Amblyomma americanum]|uniref:Uncharacterized protein n=1 Tax=Amblyomma americanum TaxID=6943 RepID=A0AAQ4EG16_AMBAM
MFDLQQPSSLYGYTLVLNAWGLRKVFPIAYGKMWASYVLAAYVSLLGGALECVPPFFQTLDLLCDFSFKRSLLAQLYQYSKPVSDAKDYAGESQPLMKTTADVRHNVIVDCILQSLLLAQHGQDGYHGVSIYVPLLILHCPAVHKTNSVFEAPRDFGTPGLVTIEGTQELVALPGYFVQDASEAFCLMKILGLSSPCALTPYAFNVIGSVQPHINALKHLSRDAEGFLRIAIGPLDETRGIILPLRLDDCKRANEKPSDLPLAKAATRLLRLTADPTDGAPAVLLPSAVRDAIEDEEELVHRLEEEHATAGVGDGQGDRGRMVRQLRFRTSTCSRRVVFAASRRPTPKAR